MAIRRLNFPRLDAGDPSQRPVDAAELEAFFARARTVVASVNEALALREAVVAFIGSPPVATPDFSSTPSPLPSRGPTPEPAPTTVSPRHRQRQPLLIPTPAPHILHPRHLRTVAPTPVFAPSRTVPSAPSETVLHASSAAAPPPALSQLEQTLAAIANAPEGLSSDAATALLGATTADELFARLGPALREGRLTHQKVAGERRWFAVAKAAPVALPTPLQELLARIEAILHASPAGARVSDVAAALGTASADEVFAALGLLGREGRAVRMTEGKRRLWFAPTPAT